MSTLVLLLLRENPVPGLAVASLNAGVGLFLIGVGVLLGIAISLLACLEALADPDSLYAGQRAQRSVRT